MKSTVSAIVGGMLGGSLLAGCYLLWTWLFHLMGFDDMAGSVTDPVLAMAFLGGVALGVGRQILTPRDAGGSPADHHDQLSPSFPDPRTAEDYYWASPSGVPLPLTPPPRRTR